MTDNIWQTGKRRSQDSTNQRVWSAGGLHSPESTTSKTMPSNYHYLDMPGFFGRDGGPVEAGDEEVGVRRETVTGVVDLGSRDVDGEARAAVGVVTVRVCATCVWYVTVVVVRPPADFVSVRDVVWTSMVGDWGPTSLDSETSELTDARLLGRLLPWLGAGLAASPPHNTQPTSINSSSADNAMHIAVTITIHH